VQQNFHAQARAPAVHNSSKEVRRGLPRLYAEIFLESQLILRIRLSFWEMDESSIKHKVPPAYSRAGENARSLNSCRDDG
jgi:hypothetical protein